MSTRLLRLMEQVKYQQKWPTCDTRAFAEPQNRDSWLKVTVFFFIDWFGHCSYFCVNHRIQSHDCRHRFRPPSTVRPSANSCCFTAHSRGIADEVHGVSCQKWTAASWGSHPTGTLAHSKSVFTRNYHISIGYRVIFNSNVNQWIFGELFPFSNSNEGN